ncbi:MAG TPA: cupredoxin domain-containing protein [Solirubrobacterales bacterium]|nr:cupredoxin domain-containing protein [Solirubrobacterales bacterium]
MLVSLLLVAGGAGCGGDEGAETLTVNPDVQGSPQLQLEADPDGELAFNAEEAVGSAGNVSFVLENPSTRAHTIAVENKRGEQLGASRVAIKDSEFVIVSLEPGTYTYYCTVRGHREAGMEGTLTIEPD